MSVLDLSLLMLIPLIFFCLHMTVRTPVRVGTNYKRDLSHTSLIAYVYLKNMRSCIE